MSSLCWYFKTDCELFHSYNIARVCSHVHTHIFFLFQLLLSSTLQSRKSSFSGNGNFFMFMFLQWSKLVSTTVKNVELISENIFFPLIYFWHQLYWQLSSHTHLSLIFNFSSDEFSEKKSNFHLARNPIKILDENFFKNSF